MKNCQAFLLAFLCLGCKIHQSNKNQAVGIVYDCRLVSAEFDELPYVLGKAIEPAYRKFKNSVEDGVFFTSRYFNHSNSTKAIVMDLKMQEQWNYSTDSTTKSSMNSQTNFDIKELVAKVEKGSFRQACIQGSSEGSMSLLLVKTNGRITFKFEASQHDYSYLNKSEKGEIKNALELISLLDK
ncbi:hypothetical protein AHMF7605_12135 [Adhaeribacter arboris]|uniref:Uncharacterized protein n=1 Tax=Adhaeribacter arboris TaxID=2072846 RepID=A0A2T2YFD2_9BACT|nr:hypothetical protein [Adhaeribacter arboris]PSR54217.1 hypothetical protein AHMF7605_12135 [Adhaeribacter arboris]